MFFEKQSLTKAIMTFIKDEWANALIAIVLGTVIMEIAFRVYGPK